ncbi:hypothetical protein FH972_026539 [Carpinus fangiana]|uniref:Uncharacterized protein n=1 Tax=Carpinus fangiana TaxID=176857 RepID=A0A5N6KR07_9ROSI|nr:hypothetical protein FH972_021823 [Carpinus fangiana]KAB8754748.1 hypothetical protein FH972_026539 [Carpinus fangiana]
MAPLPEDCSTIHSIIATGQRCPGCGRIALEEIVPHLQPGERGSTPATAIAIESPQRPVQALPIQEIPAPRHSTSRHFDPEEAAQAIRSFPSIGHTRSSVQNAWGHRNTSIARTNYQQSYGQSDAGAPRHSQRPAAPPYQPPRPAIPQIPVTIYAHIAEFEGASQYDPSAQWTRFPNSFARTTTRFDNNQIYTREAFRNEIKHRLEEWAQNDLDALAEWERNNHAFNKTAGFIIANTITPPPVEISWPHRDDDQTLPAESILQVFPKRVIYFIVTLQYIPDDGGPAAATPEKPSPKKKNTPKKGKVKPEPGSYFRKPTQIPPPRQTVEQEEVQPSRTEPYMLDDELRSESSESLRSVFRHPQPLTELQQQDSPQIAKAGPSEPSKRVRQSSAGSVMAERLRSKRSHHNIVQTAEDSQQQEEEEEHQGTATGRGKGKAKKR